MKFPSLLREKILPVSIERHEYHLRLWEQCSGAPSEKQIISAVPFQLIIFHVLNYALVNDEDPIYINFSGHSCSRGS